MCLAEFGGVRFECGPTGVWHPAMPSMNADDILGRLASHFSLRVTEYIERLPYLKAAILNHGVAPK